MQIASNKINDVISFYKSELKTVYSDSEIDEIVKQCFTHYLNYSKTDIIFKNLNGINQSDLLKLYDCCNELKKNKPLQYILGECIFYNLPIKVNPSVLIPRPETEELVDIILKQYIGTQSLAILDIGTGSGCIAIALKNNLGNCNVTAIDVSLQALETAKYNAEIHQAEIEFKLADILQESSLEELKTYDIIVSNPPYVLKHEYDSLHDRVKLFEPHLALFVDNENPLLFYEKILNFCASHLNKYGKLYFELNPMHAFNMGNLADENYGFSNVQLLKDMSGNERFLIATK